MDDKTRQARSAMLAACGIADAERTAARPVVVSQRTRDYNRNLAGRFAGTTFAPPRRG